MIARLSRTVFLTMVLTGWLGGCETGPVVLAYPESPPDLIGRILALDHANGVLVLRDDAGVDHSIVFTRRTSVARRVMNLVTSEKIDGIERGDTVEIWLRSDREEQSSQRSATERSALHLIVVDLADVPGAELESLQPSFTSPQGGLQPIP